MNNVLMYSLKCANSIVKIRQQELKYILYLYYTINSSFKIHFTNTLNVRMIPIFNDLKVVTYEIIKL